MLRCVELSSCILLQVAPLAAGVLVIGNHAAALLVIGKHVHILCFVT
jgi:hypothetical protein